MILKTFDSFIRHLKTNFPIKIWGWPIYILLGFFIEIHKSPNFILFNLLNLHLMSSKRLSLLSTVIFSTYVALQFRLPSGLVDRRKIWHLLIFLEVYSFEYL